MAARPSRRPAQARVHRLLQAQTALPRSVRATRGHGEAFRGRRRHLRRRGQKRQVRAMSTWATLVVLLLAARVLMPAVPALTEAARAYANWAGRLMRAESLAAF